MNLYFVVVWCVNNVAKDYHVEKTQYLFLRAIAAHGIRKKSKVYGDRYSLYSTHSTVASPSIYCAL